VADFEQFERRLDLWNDCIGGDDRHSIARQIADMNWWAASWNIVNKSRRFIPRDEYDRPKANSLMHDLINAGFMSLEITAIRRLLDRGELEGQRGVCSLVAVINDMTKHAALLTRKNFCRRYGYGYPVRVPEEGDRSSASRPERGIQDRPGPVHAGLARGWHEMFDDLALVDPGARSPDDRIDHGVMERLRERLLEASGPFLVYANKYIAHAATPASRDHEHADDLAMTYDESERVRRRLCETFSLLAIVLSRVRHDLIPHAINPLGYLDENMGLEPEASRQLREEWSRFRAATEEWSRWSAGDCRRELDEAADDGAPSS